MSTLQDELQSGTRDVVELLATWGAAAQPSVADMLAALASFDRSDERSIVSAVLDTPGIALSEELRREASDLLATADAPSSRIADVVDRLCPAVWSSVAAGRVALRDELQSWSALLDAAELDAVLRLVWRGEDAAGIADQLGAARWLEQARGILGKARWRIDGELRGLVEGADAELSSRIGAVLERGDPHELSNARRELSALRLGAAGTLQAADMDAARTRVARLRERVLTVSRAADRGAGELLALLLDRSGSALEEAGTGQVEDRACVEQLGLWERALTDAAEAPKPGGTDPGAWVEALCAQLRAEVDRSPDAANLTGALEELAAAPAGGTAFVAALARGGATLNAHRTDRRTRLETTGAELRDAARRLEAELTRTAGDLSTKCVVSSRVLLERVEETVADGDPAAAEALAVEIRHQLERIGRMVEAGNRHRHGRIESERRRLKAEAHGLLQIASPRAGRRVRALQRRLEDAAPGDLKRLSADLSGEARRVGNSVRLQAARVVEWLNKRGEDDAATELGAAFDRDDLESMSELATEPGRRRARAANSRRLVAVAVAVAIAGVSFLVLRSRGERGFSYELTMASSEVPCVKLWLVQDGSIDQELACSAGTTSVELLRGSYEVYVNERYTGRVIKVPGASEGDLRDIPVPPLPPSTEDKESIP